MIGSERASNNKYRNPCEQFVAPFRSHTTNPMDAQAAPPIPPFFLCPITYGVMVDPVMAADGTTFDRFAIEAWFVKGKDTNPLTGEKLANTNLIPNKILKSQIEWHIAQTAAVAEAREKEAEIETERERERARERAREVALRDADAMREARAVAQRAEEKEANEHAELLATEATRQHNLQALRAAKREIDRRDREVLQREREALARVAAAAKAASRANRPARAGSDGGGAGQARAVGDGPGGSSSSSSSRGSSSGGVGGSGSGYPPGSFNLFQIPAPHVPPPLV